MRQQQAATLARTQRRLRWLVLIAALILTLLWLKNGGLAGAGGLPVLGLILVGFLASFILGRRRALSLSVATRSARSSASRRSPTSASRA